MSGYVAMENAENPASPMTKANNVKRASRVSVGEGISTSPTLDWYMKSTPKVSASEMDRRNEAIKKLGRKKRTTG